MPMSMASSAVAGRLRSVRSPSTATSSSLLSELRASRVVVGSSPLSGLKVTDPLGNQGGVLTMNTTSFVLPPGTSTSWLPARKPSKVAVRVPVRAWSASIVTIRGVGWPARARPSAGVVTSIVVSAPAGLAASSTRPRPAINAASRRLVPIVFPLVLTRSPSRQR